MGLRVLPWLAASWPRLGLAWEPEVRGLVGRRKQWVVKTGR